MVRPVTARWTRVIPVAALLALLPFAVADDAGQESPAAEQAEQAEPLDLGLTEHTGMSLLFLDVEALDGQGHPRPGLVKEDFKIRVNYVWRKIYSVDDLCPCLADPGPPNPEAPPGVKLARMDPEAPAVVRDLNRPVYVIYFDTSQLQPDGRRIALDEARRWVRELKQSEDEAMIVAYSRETGVRRASPVTGDADVLLRAIQSIDDDPVMTDEFPAKLAGRMRMCWDGTVSCYYTGRKEYFQSRASYRSLLNFVTELDEIPRRKVLFFFHQNNAIFPGRLYTAGGLGVANLGYDPLDPTGVSRQVNDIIGGGTVPVSSGGEIMFDGSPSNLVPDLVDIVDAIGGTATASRTTIYPLVAGFSQTWVVNFGANVADFTGWRYNRGGLDLPEIVDRAGRGCGCFYRIGLRVDERSKSKVFRTKVKIKGQPLRSRYRVQFVTEADRWMRKAQSILENPSEFGDVELHAAIVPLRGGDKRWDLRVQVAVDLDSLMLSTENEENQGEWEIGALLADSNGKNSHEMLAISRLRTKPPDEREEIDEGEEQESMVVHERTFTGLKAGTYQLRAFIKDRAATMYGGAETEIELPVIEDRALVGPLVRRAPVMHLSSSLPMRDAKADSAQDRSVIRKGALPRTDGRFEQGHALELTTWVCPSAAKQARTQLSRQVLLDDSPAVPLERPRTKRAGDCIALSDRLETDGLEVGPYTYRVTWSHTAEAPPLEAETTFEIVSPAEAPANSELF